MNHNSYTLQRNVSLKPFNTFAVNARAKLLASVTTEVALQKLLADFSGEKLNILGGGSNLLLTKDLEGLTVLIRLKGKKILPDSDDENHVIVEAAAGEVWHELVLWAIENGLGGIENLALIPGRVGAAPIQNIGAYGVELKDVFHSCDALAADGSHSHTFTATACRFSYRDSVFKNEYKDQYIITRVRLKLTSKNHQIHTDYGAVQTELIADGVQQPTPAQVANAVIRIRENKLPNPAEIPNSGSFFKNPVIEEGQFEKLKVNYPKIPFYKQEIGVKIPAGWLIEQCGFKGKKTGRVGVHEKQALVLVNLGGADGLEIKVLAENIQTQVLLKFDIRLETEVNIW